MYYSSHIATAKQLLSGYDPQIPLHVYLKKYFHQNKKHGSKDRKLIAAMCYNYFRLGFSFKDVPVEERILTGFFLCETMHSDFLHFFKPEWNKAINKSLEEKLAIGFDNHQEQSSIKNIFPFKDELSTEVDPEKFNLSFLQQPKLFIRIRPGQKNVVLKKLQAAGVKYELISESCIATANSSKIDAVIELDKEAVVQDYNSQRTGEFLKFKIQNLKSKIAVWDCCAGSGGKSIMAYDINPRIQLTVSDKRKTILENLQKRFIKAGIKNYQSFVADFTTANCQLSTEKFDLIIADVPCTGSGTWARTPEQLYYFNQKQIKKYSALQKQIVENVVPYLKPGGHFLYITCSVYKKENEEIVNFIEEKFNLKVVKVQLLKGYEIQADTLFAALFKIGLTIQFDPETSPTVPV